MTGAAVAARLLNAKARNAEVAALMCLLIEISLRFLI
jgi:hypothetical protein